MIMMKIFLQKVTILFAILCPVIANAKNITAEEAQHVAKNFYYERAGGFFAVDYNHIDFQNAITVKENEEDLFYIFNLRSDKGFVIVAATDNVIPVLAYSFEGKFIENELPGNIKDWLDSYRRQILNAKKNNYPDSEYICREWQRLMSSDISALKDLKGERAVAPLLVSTWNQDAYYNAWCPVDSAGPGDRCYAGCVATAMGQLMFYHRFPDQGTGTYTYSLPKYGTLSADFGNTTYHWDAMQNAINDPSNTAIAQLLYHLGVSVDMVYGPNGSGMWNHKAAYSLRTYFKYCPQTQYLFRDSTTLNWDSVLVANLDAHKPLYYAGWASNLADSSGHAFVCDGYQGTNYYHFNWGWGGYDDGYFYTSSLNPSGYDFNYHQELIHDIYPDTSNYTYPEYCDNSGQVNSSSGTIEDGSGMKNYKDSLQCGWLVSSNCGYNVYLKFTRFDLAAGDSLFVYRGKDVGGSILGIFTAGNPPVLSSLSNPTILYSDTNAMFIRFVTDDSLNAGGWQASYYGVYCDLSKTLTDSMGTVSDGSGSCDYKNSTNCRWTVQPANVNRFTMSFTEFDLASGSTGDYIQLFKNSLSTPNLIATYTYANQPPAVISFDANAFVLRFITNSSSSSGGWSFSYIGTDDAGITESGDHVHLFVFPNPVDDNSTLYYDVPSGGPVNIRLSDISGRTLASLSVEHPAAGQNSILLNTLASGLQSGIYMLNVSCQSFSETLRLVKL
jgi:hypothetical protein